MLVGETDSNTANCIYRPFPHLQKVSGNHFNGSLHHYLASPFPHLHKVSMPQIEVGFDEYFTQEKKTVS
jgi:hypothetical protein